jgi:osmoprotectant transport system permease protein
MKLVEYVVNNWAMLLGLAWTHVVMVVIGLALALIAGIPLGVICARNEKWARWILAAGNTLQVFPSLAMLVLLMLVFGLGFYTVTIGLFLYSLLPIIRNTYVGLKEVDKSIMEAGRGIGMSDVQLLVRIQLPLALPYLMAGLRVAAVIAIGVATIAPLIGGEGLGREIYAGINLRNNTRILAGTIPAALLAILADWFLGKLQKKTVR